MRFITGVCTVLASAVGVSCDGSLGPHEKRNFYPYLRGPYRACVHPLQHGGLHVFTGEYYRGSGAKERVEFWGDLSEDIWFCRVAYLQSHYWLEVNNMGDTTLNYNWANGGNGERGEDYTVTSDQCKTLSTRAGDVVRLSSRTAGAWTVTANDAESEQFYIEVNSEGRNPEDAGLTILYRGDVTYSVCALWGEATVRIAVERARTSTG